MFCGACDIGTSCARAICGATDSRFSSAISTPDAVARAAPIAEAINRLGFPNYYGEQRFGREKETLRIGLELLQGKVGPESIAPARRRFLLRMSLSAVQSALFNVVLAERLRDSLFSTVSAGRRDAGGGEWGQFVAIDAAAEQQRFDSRQILLTGPIFGPRMTAPQHEPAAREGRVLSAWGCLPSTYAVCQTDERHAAAAGRLPDALRVENESDGLRFDVRLPAASMQPPLLREFLKTPAGDLP